MSVIIARRGAGATPAPIITADPVFANNSWEEIIEICQSGAVPGTWLVGDSKIMTIGGSEYQIDIIGINHDTYADGTGTVPATFQLHDCYNASYQMNPSPINTGGWTASEMRTVRMAAVLAAMPTEVQSNIRAVNKLTSAGQTSAVINTDADKIFLLSEVEVFGNNVWSKPGEGKQYEYYTAGSSKVKKQNGIATPWWLRSPEGSVSANFCHVDADGNTGYAAADNSQFISFAFCF